MIRRFLNIPLLPYVAMRLVAKPLGMIEPEDYVLYRKMYDQVLKSIRLDGRNWLERRIIWKLVDWLEKEIAAISTLEMQSVVIVQENTVTTPMPWVKETNDSGRLE